LTETTGQPTSSLQQNGTQIDSWTFEENEGERVRIKRDVDISIGDVIRVLSSRSGGASAKISKIVFKPADEGTAALRAGFTYFASVRVNDGETWSPWYITRFTMAGSAWASSVSNETGWTIGFSARVFPLQAE
jgi:hypothetical protein